LTKLAATTPALPASIVARVGNKTYFAFESYGPFYPDKTGPQTLDLYVTDGTAAGTRSVWRQTFTAKPGSYMANFNFTPVGNRLYFTPPFANAAELWTTDGTVGGTKLVHRGPDASPIQHLVDAAGTLYFTEAGKLWRSDGTSAGTTAVLTLPSPGTAPGDAPNLTAVGSRLFFVGDDPYRKGNLRAYDTASATAPGASAAAAVTSIRVGLPPITISKRRLTVNGSADRDTLSIYVKVKRGTLNVVWNGIRSSFAVSDVRSVTVNGLDGDDSIVLDGPVPWAVLNGGNGNDYLAGGSGNDTLNGGAGYDTLADGAGADAFSGGDGEDRVDYLGRTDNLTLSHDDVANDGAAGVGYNIMTDV
jgi:ELWxxDGT repeat protein